MSRYEYVAKGNDDLVLNEKLELVKNESFAFQRISNLVNTRHTHYNERAIKNYTLFQLTARFPANLSTEERNNELQMLYAYINKHFPTNEQDQKFRGYYKKYLLIFNINFLLVKPSTKTVQMFYGTTHDSQGLKGINSQDIDKIYDNTIENAIDKTMFEFYDVKDLIAKLPPQDVLIEQAKMQKENNNLFDESNVQIGPVINNIFTICIKFRRHPEIPGINRKGLLIKHPSAQEYVEAKPKDVEPNRKRRR